MSLIESFHQTITEDGPRRGIYPPQVAAIHFTFYLFFTKEKIKRKILNSMGKPGRDVHRSNVDLCKSKLNTCLNVCRSKVYFNNAVIFSNL